MSTVVRVQIQQRIDTSSNWSSSNPVLLAGEVGHESNTRKYKLGDGSTAWNSLSYAGVTLLDEDNFSSNSATAAASQQSIKAYVDGKTYPANLTNSASGTALTILSSSGTDTNLPAATTSAWGVMTDEDKTKLDAIATSANNYTHPNHSGEVTSSADGAQTIADNVVDEANLKISNAGSNGQFLQKSSNTGGLTWASPSGGATGGGSDSLFMEFDKVMTTSYSIAANKHAITFGPIALNSGVVLTIPSTSKLLVLT